MIHSVVCNETIKNNHLSMQRMYFTLWRREGFILYNRVMMKKKTFISLLNIYF